MQKPIVLCDPRPRSLDLMFGAPDMAKLNALAEVIATDQRKMPSDQVESHLPNVTFIMGQTDMPRERLDRAPKLKAILNVEGFHASKEVFGSRAVDFS